MADVIFNGSSRFATDFSQVIDRAIGVASLPLLQLEQQKVALSDQQKALSSVDVKFEGLQTAIGALKTAASKDELSTNVSDGKVVKTTIEGSVLAGSYTVEVTSLGAKETALSQSGLPTVSDPASQSISTATEFTLTVDGVEHTILPAGAGLTHLAEAINASGAGVTATIVNVGPSSAPDYRLSLQGQELGAVGIQLNDGSADLLDTISAGAPLQYRVNGSSLISSASRSVTLAPGLTGDLLALGSAEITVASSTNGIVQGLSGLVNAFNSAVAELDLHRGENAGVLASAPVMASLSQALRSLTGYSSAGMSLADLGINLSQDGILSFDATAITAATDEQLDAIRGFLGNGQQDGFAKFAFDTLEGIERLDTGILESAKTALQDQMKRQDEAIAVQEERLEAMAADLQARMAAADALIAALEQQVQQVTAIFEAMRESREQNN